MASLLLVQAMQFRVKASPAVFCLLIANTSSFRLPCVLPKYGNQRWFGKSHKPIAAVVPPFGGAPASLVQSIREAYDQGETDGILNLASSMDLSVVAPEDIVAASWEASEKNRGVTASILNAWIGSCCLMEDKRAATKLTRGYLKAFEDAEQNKLVAPDVVTYSLAYAAFEQNPQASQLAEGVLYEAQRRAKKLSGSKRRKSLVATRSRPPKTCQEAEDDLKEICGDHFQVLKETDEYVVINKPSGVCCSHKKTTTAGKLSKKKSARTLATDVSLEDALTYCNVPLSTLNHESLGLVHRLDRGSSGCLILAKADSMHALLVSEFFLRRTQKKYIAIVGPAPDESLTEGMIESPVDGKSAKTFYRVRERFGKEAALIEFDIYTGRKHQIRVHSAEVLSAPLLMDKWYSKVNYPFMHEIVEENPRAFPLHSLSLTIPTYDIQVEATVPQWWNNTLALLGQHETR